MRNSSLLGLFSPSSHFKRRKEKRVAQKTGIEIAKRAQDFFTKYFEQYPKDLKLKYKAEDEED